MQNNVTGDAFDFNKMVLKLEREIKRLEAAQEALDADAAMDHALNGALTGFHLLEWEAKSKDINEKRGARELLVGKECEDDFKLLHDVVTRTKHLTIGKSEVDEVIDVRTSAGTSTGLGLCGVPVSRKRKLFVKFGDERAERVLKTVLTLFKSKGA